MPLLFSTIVACEYGNFPGSLRLNTFGSLQAVDRKAGERSRVALIGVWSLHPARTGLYHYGVHQGTSGAAHCRGGEAPFE